MAFPEDGPSRGAVVRTAVARAAMHYRQLAFNRVVSVGDADCDILAAERLRSDGARHVAEKLF